MAEAALKAAPLPEAAQPVGTRSLEVRNIAALLTGQGMTWGLSFLLTLFLPRYLGAVNLGKLTFAASIAEMAREFVLLGTSTFLVREIARERSRLSAYLGHALLLRTMASVVVAAAAVGMAR